MADTKLSDLTLLAAGGLADADEFYVNDGGVSKRLLASSLSRYAGERLGLVNVLDYGAVGDAITDDSSAIQAAVDAAEAAGGGIIVFPTSTYLISTGIVIEGDNVQIDLNMSQVNTSGNIVAFRFGPAAAGTTNHQRGGIYNGRINGSGSGNSGNRALEIRNHAYGRFSNLRLTNFGAKPLFVNSYQRGVYYNKFDTIEIYDNHDGAIELNSGTHTSSFLNDNLFLNVHCWQNPVTGGGSITHVLIDGTAGAELKGNRFIACGIESTEATDTLLDFDFGTHNYFEWLRLDGTATTEAVNIAAGVNDNHIRALVIQDTITDAGSDNVVLDLDNHKIRLPVQNSATTPTLAFADDMGLYAASTTTLNYASAGTARWQFSGNEFFGAQGASAELLNETTSGTNPTVLARKADYDTGLGSNAADELSLIAAGVETIRIDADATAGNTRMFVYDVDNATLERVSVGAADSGGTNFKVLRIPN